MGGEVGKNLAPHRRPSLGIAVRLALVHEFKTRSRVFIATEAGAKGLNLQFCDTIVNYDLPWNPQRIEQRIGRCHRYGQTRDVTVVNFLAKDNEAQRLTLEILTQKLDLFGNVLDMSDSVLHEARSDRSEELATALGPDFEKQLNRIWERARSVDEVEDELRRLRETMEERRAELEQVKEHTTGLIETRFDDSVKQVFRRIADELPTTLAELDADLERVVTDYLQANKIDYSTESDDGPSTDPSPRVRAAARGVVRGNISGRRPCGRPGRRRRSPCGSSACACSDRRRSTSRIWQLHSAVQAHDGGARGSQRAPRVAGSPRVEPCVLSRL